jgi:hypothetical protein
MACQQSSSNLGSISGSRANYLSRTVEKQEVSKLVHWEGHWSNCSPKSELTGRSMEGYVISLSVSYIGSSVPRLRSTTNSIQMEGQALLTSQALDARCLPNVSHGYRITYAQTFHEPSEAGMPRRLIRRRTIRPWRCLTAHCRTAVNCGRPLLLGRHIHDRYPLLIRDVCSMMLLS